MGHRLSKIYTRTGDNGTTSLGDGTRADKDSMRIEAHGELDELNSAIGLLLTEPLPENIRAALTGIQHDLFDLGGELCVPDRCAITGARITELEVLLDALNDKLSPLKEFILPGGSRAAALTHVARTVCRRAERRMVALNRAAPLNPASLGYINRLSDLLFVMARALNAAAGQADVLWQPGKNSAQT
jgi:cob(I)alamin adenosyltransferase